LFLGYSSFCFFQGGAKINGIKDSFKLRAHLCVLALSACFREESPIDREHAVSPRHVRVTKISHDQEKQAKGNPKINTPRGMKESIIEPVAPFYPFPSC
jgi:hypothetical protein